MQIRMMCAYNIFTRYIMLKLALVMYNMYEDFIKSRNGHVIQPGNLGYTKSKDKKLKKR